MPDLLLFIFVIMWKILNLWNHEKKNYKTPLLASIIINILWRSRTFICTYCVKDKESEITCKRENFWPIPHRIIMYNYMNGASLGCSLSFWSPIIFFSFSLSMFTFECISKVPIILIFFYFKRMLHMCLNNTRAGID